MSETYRAPVEARPPSGRAEIPAASGDEDPLAPEGYTVTALIASSGRGDIYRAKDRSGHDVAMRVLAPSRYLDGEALETFTRDARASLRLQHPHIVRSIAAGQSRERRWLIMELVEGASLRSHVLDGGPLPERQAVVLLAQLAQALGYAWRHGVAHFDVEAANILLAAPRVGHQEPFCAKLANFGFSLLRDPGHGAGRSREERAAHDHRAAIRGLASTICWSLTPEERGDGGPATLALEGISLETMQLLGAMLDADASRLTWEAVIERARRLPALHLTQR